MAALFRSGSVPEFFFGDGKCDYPMINAHNDMRMITAMMIRFSLSLVWTFCLLWYLDLVAITRFVYCSLRTS
jgi:hypothetical protein